MPNRSRHAQRGCGHNGGAGTPLLYLLLISVLVPFDVIQMALALPELPSNWTDKILSQEWQLKSELIQKTLVIAPLLFATVQFSGATAEFFQKIPGPTVGALTAKGRVALVTSAR